MAGTKSATNNNMKIYEGHREPPKEALKTIGAGRLRGMSDINPMWRIKALTEEFGPCGIGWYYTVDQQWLEATNNETVAFVNISLFIKVDGEWSKPIFGTGGSKFVAMEKSGPFVSDEAYKMATTDAISVACKQLGIAADVYWNSDRTKYSSATDDSNSQNKSTPNKTKVQEDPAAVTNVDKRLLPTADNKMSKEQYDYLMSEIKRTDALADVVKYHKSEDLTTMTSSKCIAVLTGLLKRPTKTA